MRVWKAGPVVGVAVVLAGCGGSTTKTVTVGTSGGDPTVVGRAAPDANPPAGDAESQIRAVAAQYVAAYKTKDFDSACDVLTPALQEKAVSAAGIVGITDPTCAKVLAAADKADPAASLALDLSKLKVSGSRAVAVDAVRDKDGRSDARFERINGKWLVSSDGE